MYDKTEERGRETKVSFQAKQMKERVPMIPNIHRKEEKVPPKKRGKIESPSPQCAKKREASKTGGRRGNGSKAPLYMKKFQSY